MRPSGSSRPPCCARASRLTLHGMKKLFADVDANVAACSACRRRGRHHQAAARRIAPRLAGTAASRVVSLASGWRFQSRPEMKPYLDRLSSREAAEVFAGHAGNTGDHRLPPAGHARRHRGNPRRRGQFADDQDAGRPRLDRRGRPPRSTGTSRRCWVPPNSSWDDLGPGVAGAVAAAAERWPTCSPEQTQPGNVGSRP